SPAYGTGIRTTFVVCIRRGEITGATSRGKRPALEQRRCSEDGIHPFRCFWKKPADRLVLRTPAQGDVDVRVTKQPEHGTTELIGATLYPTFPKENIRYKCNQHKVRGHQLNYKSSEKYTGSDSLEVLVLYPGGFAREVNFTINVR